MKGIAILMMVFYHLFIRTDFIGNCAPLFTIQGVHFCQWLTHAANPVSFFVMLGGYGMYAVYKKGDNHRFSRILKIYVHYWFILSLFVTIGCFLLPSEYPGSVSELLLNLSSFSYSYNQEYWFLLPYIILTFASPYLFKFTEKVPTLVVILVSLFLTMIMSWVTNEYKHSFFSDHRMLQILARSIKFLLAFMVGAMSARERWFYTLRQRFRGWYVWILIIILYLVRCFDNHEILNVPFYFCLITLLLSAPIHSQIDRILCDLGNKSMDIWFIHTWLCYYLFQNFIYSFYYPSLIFLMTMAMSYVLALIVNWTINIFTKKI